MKRVIIENGKLLFADQDPHKQFADTHKQYSQGIIGFSEFRISDSGELFLVDHSESAEHKHERYSGSVRIVNGQVQEITAKLQNLNELMNYFYSKGVDLAFVRVNLSERLPDLMLIEPSEAVNREFRPNTCFTYYGFTLQKYFYTQFIRNFLQNKQYHDIRGIVVKCEMSHQTALSDLSKVKFRDMGNLVSQLPSDQPMLSTLIPSLNSTVAVTQFSEQQEESKYTDEQSLIEGLTHFSAHPYVDPAIRLQLFLPLLQQPRLKNRIKRSAPEETVKAIELCLRTSQRVNDTDNHSLTYLKLCADISINSENTFKIAKIYHQGIVVNQDLNLALDYYDKAFELERNAFRLQQIYQLVRSMDFGDGNENHNKCLDKMYQRLYDQPNDDYTAVSNRLFYLEYYSDDLQWKVFPERIIQGLVSLHQEYQQNRLSRRAYLALLKQTFELQGLAHTFSRSRGYAIIEAFTPDLALQVLEDPGHDPAFRMDLLRTACLSLKFISAQNNDFLKRLHRVINKNRKVNISGAEQEFLKNSLAKRWSGFETKALIILSEMNDFVGDLSHPIHGFNKLISQVIIQLAVNRYDLVHNRRKIKELFYNSLSDPFILSCFHQLTTNDLAVRSTVADVLADKTNDEYFALSLHIMETHQNLMELFKSYVSENQTEHTLAMLAQIHEKAKPFGASAGNKELVELYDGLKEEKNPALMAQGARLIFSIYQHNLGQHDAAWVANTPPRYINKMLKVISLIENEEKPEPEEVERCTQVKNAIIDTYILPKLTRIEFDLQNTTPVELRYIIKWAGLGGLRALEVDKEGVYANAKKLLESIISECKKAHRGQEHRNMAAFALRTLGELYQLRSAKHQDSNDEKKSKRSAQKSRSVTAQALEIDSSASTFTFFHREEKSPPSAAKKSGICCFRRQ